MEIISIVGIILFLYLMWRNLRDDYKAEELISFSWMSVFVFFAGGRLAYGLFNWGIWNNEALSWFTFWSNKGMDIVGGYIFLLIVMYFVAKFNDWKVWSLAEDGIGNFLILVFFLLTNELIFGKFSLRIALNLIILLIAFLLSSWLRKKYRSFVWYKSGKKGFIFCFVNFFVLLLLSLVSIWFKDRAIYSYLYLGGSLLSLVELFILGDIWIIKK
jgi:hypothetical protein